MTDAPTPAQDDLFPLPMPTEIGPPPGTVEGPPGWHEGFGAGLRVWCGQQAGWRSLGDVLGGARPVGCLMFHRGRLRVALAFDLGPYSIRRPGADVDPGGWDNDEGDPHAT